MAINKNSKAYQNLLNSGYTDDQITQMHSATSSGQSASSVVGSNSSFVDPSVLQDQQRGLSQGVIDTKWGTGTSSALEQQNKTYGTGNYSTSTSYYNPATGYYESVPSGSTSGNRGLTTYTANSGAKVVNSPYTNQGAGSYKYNPTSGFYEKVVGNNTEKGLTYQEDTDYYGTLYDKDKFSPETTYQREGDNTNPLTNTNVANQDNTNVDLTGNVNQNMNKWGSFTQAVNSKLQTAFGMQDLNELKSKYPEQYSSLIQALDSVAGTWNSLDPSQRGLLEGQLQAIIGTAVGAGSDTSKLNVLNESIMNKFENGQQVADDMKNIIKLQTEGLTTKEIAKKMGVSEDQVQQAILAYNGLDNRLGEYYKLKSKEAAEITEPYDTKIERLQKEKEIQLERANRQVEWMKEDFDKNLERQKQANEINLHNADFMAGQYGFGFSKRGIEGMNYVTDQAKQIIDDMVTNYDRNSQEMADGVADILRNWERNNEDLLKASEDALNTAKNNYTSNMLAIQQQYGTVGMQAQQQLANNVQNFITQAETIYDNALNRQQQNLTNLITNFSNLNALQYSNLTLRNAQIQQFQSESMNLNRNQLQGLAQQLGMDSASMQDLVNYQAQAVANELNGYIPGAGMQFQNQIQSYLNQGYTPNQALSMIMNSQDFKAMQSTGGGENRAMSGGIMYNKSTGQYIDLNGDEYGTIGENLYNKRTGQIIQGGASGANNYVTSQIVNGQTYGVSENTYNGLVSFYNKFADANGNIKKGAKGGQCGSFVNDYLQSLGLSRVFVDPIDKKVAAINTPEGYQPQVGDVVVMDSPNAKTKQYGHVAIVIGVDGNKITTLESNKKGEGEVFSRTIDTSKNKVYGYYHPDGAGTTQTKNKDTDAYRMAEAILNGTGSKPAKNSKEYIDITLALDDLVKEKRGSGYPEGLDLINYSIINDNNLSDTLSTSISSTMASIYSTDTLMQLLKENNYKTGPIVSKLAKLNPRDADYAALEASINQMASNIARGFGEKGVLTDKDIERYMKTIPNEKMGNKAQDVVGTLLKAKLYDGLVRTLEAQAKNKKDVSMYAAEYKEAIDWLQKNGFRTGGGRGLTGTVSLQGYGRS